MNKFWTFCAPAAALIAEFLPWGVKMEFMNPEGPSLTELCSYFDLLPVGYGNVFPMLVSLFTCLLVLALAFYCGRGGRHSLTAGLIFSVLGAAGSILQLVFFPVTPIGILILLFMAAQAVFLGVLLGKSHKKAAD